MLCGKQIGKSRDFSALKLSENRLIHFIMYFNDPFTSKIKNEEDNPKYSNLIDACAERQFALVKAVIENRTKLTFSSFELLFELILLLIPKPFVVGTQICL